MPIEALHQLAAAQYGICPECGVRKHLTPAGVMREHNKYVPLRASALIGRCPGTGQAPAQNGGVA